MLSRYVGQIMNLYNYIDGLIVTNSNAIVEYYCTFRPDVNSLKEEDVKGKYLLDIYPNLTKETSSILRVLKNGIPIPNEYQKTITYKNDEFYAANTTLPIKDEKDNIIGAVDISRYIGNKYQDKNIHLHLKESLPKQNNDLYVLDDIITDSQIMNSLKDKIRKIAKTNSSVLIYGETGTGKELIAQSIHSSSDRSDKPFIEQNCAAIPSSLLESILFGTEKGSYTGAENRVGLFELANKGTLYLDEINSMEINIQAKILRAIEQKKIRRVGGHKNISLDIRIISSVNEDPIISLKRGKIRSDLFYRLSAVQLEVPLLLQRKKDIIVLKDYFINYFNKKMNRNIIGITEEVEALFLNYSWPGNVRELKNIIEGAFNLSTGIFIEYEHLPDYIKRSNDNFEIESFIKNHEISLQDRLEKIERKIIIDALNESKTKAQASNILKISNQSLNYKLNKYKILNCNDKLNYF